MTPKTAAGHKAAERDKTTLTLPSDREIVMMRVFNAPRHSSSRP